MNSRQVLRHHAKTFFWAWLLLPARARRPVADLYAFCREIDDVADQGGADQGGANARETLAGLRADVAAGREPRARVFERLGIERRWLLDLIDGARGDLNFVRPADEAALDLYCYRVAGVVGLMMCPLLGVKDPAAHQHAVDLGSAMQLTNIARDVAEDFGLGRIYIPATWGPLEGRAEEPARRLLARAEGLYASGFAGLEYLPWRVRAAIALAARLYRAIGTALARQGHDPFQSRAYVSLGRKVRMTLALPLGPRPRLTAPASNNLSWISNLAPNGESREHSDVVADGRRREPGLGH